MKVRSIQGPVRGALTGALVAAMTPLVAAAMALDFPDGARTLTGEALQARLAGRVFDAAAADGLRWRFEYTRLGYLFVDISNGYKDSGPFRVEGSQICVTLARAGDSCNEYRADDGAVYLKRSKSDEILILTER